MKKSLFGSLVACLFALVILAGTGSAQTVTGSVTGIITDSTGAVVVGAQVVAHNLDTGVDSPATSDSAGQYRIQFLPIGRYEVTVTAGGFGEQKVPPFQLEALQDANFNIKMTIGGTSTTVSVSEAAPIGSCGI